MRLNRIILSGVLLLVACANGSDITKPAIPDVRMAAYFSGATYADQVQAAADHFAGAYGLVIASSGMAAGAAPSPLPDGISLLDLRNTTSGAVLLLQRLVTGNTFGLNVSIQNSPDATNGIAIFGDARPAGAGTNIIGVQGLCASASSSCVFGMNEGSGGLGGPGVQGDSANLPGARGVLGTTSASGSTLANPSIGIDGLASLHATEGATIGGRFRNDNGLALLAQQNSAAGAAIGPQVVRVLSGLNASTALTIENTSTGGKRWDLTAAGAADGQSITAGDFYLWNQPDNRTPIRVAGGALSSTLMVAAKGLGVGTNVPGGQAFFNAADLGIDIRAANGRPTRFVMGSALAADPIVYNRNVAGQPMFWGEAGDTGPYSFRGSGATTFAAKITAPLFGTTTNCADSAGAAACGAAPAGAVVIDAAATTVVVSTTAVTANSRIFIQEGPYLATELSITCNITTGRLYTITALTAGASFTVTASAAPITNPACLNYWVVN